VSIGNCSFSFFCGFAVFSTVGYLQGIGSPVSDKTSGAGLSFIAFPTAIDTMPAPNLWIFILACTLFTLGLDSAFSMVEATATVITDTPTGKQIPRKLIALILCSFGALFSFVFCFNWGNTYFDVVDHYLSVYLLLLLGIFQCFGAGWVYCFDDSKQASGAAPTLVLCLGYWGALIPLAFVSVFAFPDKGVYAMLAFWIIQVIAWIASFIMSKQSCGIWYRDTFLYGVYKLGLAISRPSCAVWIPDGEDRDVGRTYHIKAMWVEPFIFYWGFCIKYFFPFAVMWLLAFSFAIDISTPYGDYYWGW